MTSTASDLQGLNNQLVLAMHMKEIILTIQPNLKSNDLAMKIFWHLQTNVKSNDIAMKKFGTLSMVQTVKSVYKWMFLYKWPLYDLFWPFFCHVYDHLSQNWGSDDHFEVLNRSYLWLVEKLWHKTQIFPFLFFLRFCTKTDICIFFVFYIFLFLS